MPCPIIALALKSSDLADRFTSLEFEQRIRGLGTSAKYELELLRVAKGLFLRFSRVLPVLPGV